jgi:hypothetical protein
MALHIARSFSVVFFSLISVKVVESLKRLLLILRRTHPALSRAGAGSKTGAKFVASSLKTGLEAMAIFQLSCGRPKLQQVACAGRFVISGLRKHLRSGGSRER